MSFVLGFIEIKKYFYSVGNPHSPFSLGPETPPPAYSPHDDGGGGGGGDRAPATAGQSMETDNNTHAEPVPYQVRRRRLWKGMRWIRSAYSVEYLHEPKTRKG